MADPYISEVKYKGGASQDFIEVAVDAGTDVSGMSITIYNADGTVRTTNALGAIVNTMGGKDVYVINVATSATFNGLHKFGGVALDDGTTVFEFISFTDNAATITATEGAASGMTSTEVGIAGSGSSLETDDSGATYFIQGAPNSGTIPACFVNGTMILTPRGERAVEDLESGDLVMTKDNGPQKILWVGRRDVTPTEHSDFQPILIKANTFSKGVPIRDLLVSPFHRLVIDGTDCEVLFDGPELLVPATYLQNNHSIVTQKMTRPFPIITSFSTITRSFSQMVWPPKALTQGKRPLMAFQSNPKTRCLRFFQNSTKIISLSEKPRAQWRGFMKPRLLHDAYSKTPCARSIILQIRKQPFGWVSNNFASRKINRWYIG